MKKSTIKRNKPNKLPLSDVICCVETFNSDGVDSSLSHSKILQELGAKIENGGVRAGLTHMIWSNGSIKHLKAAEIMDIIVVSPLWIEQCQESKSKAPESDFLITSDSVIITEKKSKIIEPIPDVANNLPEPDSPSLNSSKRLSSGSVSSSSLTITTTTTTTTQKKTQKKNKTVNEENKSTTNKKSSKSKNEKEENSDMEVEVQNNSNKLENKKQFENSSNRPNFIALSGFSGEERIFLTDLVESIVSSLSSSSSSSSSSSTVKKAVSNYGLIGDEDRSLTALTSTSYVISSTTDQIRSLRVLYAMVLGIPVVTQEWLHSCLENQQWVDVTPFLHPRFDRSRKSNEVSTTKQNSKRKTLDESLGIYVGVSETSNPSIEIVRGLVENWNITHLVTNPNDADYIIVDNQSSTTPTIYEMRSVIAHLPYGNNNDDNNNDNSNNNNLHTNSPVSDHILNLLDEGKVLTCKFFFDCIEAGKITPHLYPANRLPSENDKKRTISSLIEDNSDDDDDFDDKNEDDNFDDSDSDDNVKQPKKQSKTLNGKGTTPKTSNRSKSIPKRNYKPNVIQDDEEDEDNNNDDSEEEKKKEEKKKINNSKKKNDENVNKKNVKKTERENSSTSTSKSKTINNKTKENQGKNKTQGKGKGKGNQKDENKNKIDNNKSIDGWIDSSPNKKPTKSKNTITNNDDNENDNENDDNENDNEISSIKVNNHSLLNDKNESKSSKKRSIQSILDNDDNDNDEKSVTKRVTKKTNKSSTSTKIPSTPIPPKPSSSSSSLVVTPTPIKGSNNFDNKEWSGDRTVNSLTEESPSW